MIIVSYGGGTNSTAMLVGLNERGRRPDAITFADTGGEKPHTYRHINAVNEWCERVGFPLVEILGPVMPQQKIDGTLEQECLRLGSLPSKAYGFSSCSMKWKIEPQIRYAAAFAKRHGITQRDITRLVGFDADEPSRVERGRVSSAKQEIQQEYPLYDWGWGRDECIAAIDRAGLPQPGKSACFYCPSSKKHEILWLQKNHPDLAFRAVMMERIALHGFGPAPQTTSNGLGRSFSWEKLMTDNTEPGEYGMPEVDCGCYDGE